MCSRWPGHSCIQAAAGRHSVPHCSAEGNVNHHGERGERERERDRKSESPLTQSPWGYTQICKVSGFSAFTECIAAQPQQIHLILHICSLRYTFSLLYTDMHGDNHETQSLYVTHTVYKQAYTYISFCSLCSASLNWTITGWQCWAALGVRIRWCWWTRFHWRHNKDTNQWS